MNEALRRIAVKTEKLLSKAAGWAWPMVSAPRRDSGPRPTPRWAPAPLLRAAERTFPTLGWPRQTDSLCPICVREARKAVLSGSLELRPSKQTVLEKGDVIVGIGAPEEIRGLEELFAPREAVV